MPQPGYEWRPPERRWREQDLLDLPETGNRYELIDGSLHVAPPAGPDHHELADDIRMARRLAAPANWRVIREIGIRIPDGNLIPDIELVKGVHYDLLGTVGPDDAVEVAEPWPLRLDPSVWPR
ncbi:Uma2 family endonuclease [Micromonospora sp. A200]|uniref:Uma2 family endonuclease n=1 Tax=Micromonospora sp. A200 TaxID=2940568 RepID=UPI002474A825|nr:Uma2 family endonuclease [Micromonospora sp. A200]MDH6460205.1 Uma2 family endonuclease [Micromonospora sp. A200]